MPPLFSFSFDSILFKVGDNTDMHNILHYNELWEIGSSTMADQSFKGCLHRLCNQFATGSQPKITEIAERLQRSRKGFLEVANQSPIEISRELSFEHAQKTGRD